MKNNLLTFLVFFLAGISSLKAQDKKYLTIDEVIKLGIANSKNLKVDSAKILDAEANLLAAKNRQLPDFDLSGSYLRLAQAKIDMKQTQPSGSGSGSQSKMPKVNQVALGMANFSMPIFAGGRIKYGIQSAEYLLEAARLASENDQNNLAYTIAQAYNNLFKSSQMISVLKENLLASQKRDSVFLRLENNGIIARNDRLKAQLQTSNTDLQLLDAMNNYNIASINMNLLLGLPDNTILEIDSAYIVQSKNDQPYNYYEQAALSNRKDLQVISKQQMANNLAIKSAKAESLPSVGLKAGYVAADIPKFISVTNAINFGIGVQYNLANLWKKNSDLKKAQANQMLLQANESLLSDNIKLELNRDYQNQLFAGKKIAVYERAYEQAAENYRITKNKYDNSLVTITDLLDADAALLSTKVNLLNAKADAALAYRKLLQTAGLSETNFK